ncbi:UNKNOWN [Stylonychia lemnae]|uniref:EF-hand domain-containing protein n=1 Tax=Stylonychia lemnae TaxID=5949 RepID=A0A078BC22_STYLE|nr:UNKNOWN [Stylonychia lemnae]|eukprot:CDW90802.1 UNKNOWN [Stylonychia lemnae]
MEEQIGRQLLASNQPTDTLNLGSQQIEDLEYLVTKYISKLKMPVQSLNLSDNKIQYIPDNIGEYLTELEILNVNNNCIKDVFEAIDSIGSLSKLRSLFINLNKEEQVDYILKKVPQLEYLNGLHVDRDELYQSNSTVRHDQEQSMMQNFIDDYQEQSEDRIIPQHHQQQMQHNSRNKNKNQLQMKSIGLNNNNNNDTIYDGMMTEIRETKNEDFINTQSNQGISDQNLILGDTQELQNQLLVDISGHSLRNTQEFQSEEDSGTQQIILNFQKQLNAPQIIQKPPVQSRSSHKIIKQNQSGYALHSNTNPHNLFNDPDLNQVYQNYSRKGSTAAKSSKSNRSLKKVNSEFDDTSEYVADEDLINPDEFEEIAEIYDTIRLLHSKLDSSKDMQLAQDFDYKLKSVMEALSEVVKSERIGREVKKERSLSSKQELYSMCAEKISDYIKDQSIKSINNSPNRKGKLQVSNVISAVFEGMRGTYLDLQEAFIESIQKSDLLNQELQKNKDETHQLLLAAEHLENQNNFHKQEMMLLKNEKNEMQKYIQSLEQENEKLRSQMDKLQKSYDSRESREQVIDYPKQIPQKQLQEQLPKTVQKVQQVQQQLQQHQQSPQSARQTVRPQSSRQQVNQSNLSLSQRESSRKRNLINASFQVAMHKQNNSLSGGGTGNTHSPVPIIRDGHSITQSSRFTNFHQRNTSEQTNGSLGTVNSSLYHAFQSGFKKKMNLKGGMGSILGQSQNRNLSLKQLKDLINDIYQNKTKFDQKCQDNKQPRETMEQYMYTYLNQRYGLKNLIIEWAAAIIQGIKQFSKDDHEVALFGKILRNECDEEFRFIQQTVKDTVFALLKAILREKYPSKTEDSLNGIIENITGNNGTGVIEVWQWRKIIEKMYDDEDYQQLENQLHYKLQMQVLQNSSSQSDDQLLSLNKVKINKSGAGTNLSSSSNTLLNAMKAGVKTKMTRGQRQQLETEGSMNKLKFCTFLKTVLDFQLKEHEKFLSKFIHEFKNIDKDHDGIINEEQFKQMISVFGIDKQRIDKFLNLIDPFNNEKITFSECVQLLSSETVISQEGGESAVLEYIANYYQN